MDLRPLLQGKGRAAGVDGGGGAPHTQVLGEPEGCVHVSSHGALVGRGSSQEAPPATVEGGSDLGEAARCRQPSPPPPRSPAALTAAPEADGGHRAPGQAVRRGLAPDALSPPQALPGPGLGAGDTDVSTCLH